MRIPTYHFFVIGIILVSANMFFQKLCTKPDYGEGIERSVMQITALVALWLTAKMMYNRGE